MDSRSYDTFEEVNARLNEIVQAVADDSLPLDEALSLYEEAVNLGLRGGDLLEENIQAYDEQTADRDQTDGLADSAAPEASRDDDSAAGESAVAGGLLDDADPAASESR